MFVDLKKAHDRVPREELLNGLSRALYDGSIKAVKTFVGTTEEFCVKVGLHEKATSSCFLFAIMMDRLKDGI